MKYKYNRSLFDAYQNSFLDSLIKKGISKDLFKLLTMLNESDEPVFSRDQMSYIHSAKEKSEELFKILTQLDSSGYPVFEEFEMYQIFLGYTYNSLSIEDIKLYAVLSNDGYPIYSGEQMYEFRRGLTSGQTKEQINSYMKLNKAGQPIFDHIQMSFIRHCINDKWGEDRINIITKIVDEKPLFNYEQMRSFAAFFHRADDKSIIQIQECVNSGLNYDKIKPFIVNEVPVENIRILKTFYELGCNEDDINYLADLSVSYNDLKDIKYYLQCAKKFNIHCAYILDCDNPDKDSIRENLISEICSKRNINSLSNGHIIYKLLMCKVEPEKIDYITNAEDMFYYEQMKCIAAGFLNGLEQEDIEEAIIECKKKDTMNSADMNKLITDTRNNIEEAIRNKFGDISKVDADTVLKSEWDDLLEVGINF